MSLPVSTMLVLPRRTRAWSVLESSMDRSARARTFFWDDPPGKHCRSFPRSRVGYRNAGMDSDRRSGVVRRLGRIFVSAGKDWLDDKAPRLAAALSYYTAFSLPPLLVLLVGIGGLVLGTDLVQERLINQIGQLVGDDSALLLDEAVREAQSTGTGAAVVIGIGALLLGATGVFGQLQDALNTIWEASPKKAGGVWGLI